MPSRFDQFFSVLFPTFCKQIMVRSNLPVLSAFIKTREKSRNISEYFLSSTIQFNPINLRERNHVKVAQAIICCQILANQISEFTVDMVQLPKYGVSRDSLLPLQGYF